MQSNSGQRLILPEDLHAFLGFNRLVHSFAITTARQHTTRVFINDEDFPSHDDVILVDLEEFLGLNGVVQVSDQRCIDRFVEVVDAHPVFNLFHTRFKNSNGPLLFINFVVLIAHQATNHGGKFGVPLARLISWTTDDQRGTRLINQDRVNFVDDGEKVATLDEILFIQRHVVAQIVESKFVIRAIGDISGISSAALVGRHLRTDTSNGEAKESVNPSHPFRVTLGEVIVDRDDMDALASKRIEVSRQSRHQGLTFTSTHFSDVAQVQCGATHDLNVVVTLTQNALRGFANSGKSFGQEVVQRLTIDIALLVFSGEGF